ncbi:DUF3854 domain-containing protein [Aeromicrobium fastidiosum]|uniref:DUF3854 domain-containing protein n=1 Tax=Aeromicrobium fastidiosum TaxID=52699 RepID=A0A641AR34_9ACTN|nr:DUF3854 domain-containing protein [Aeromicrobium fastidiosum]KAA1378542.1 DUF3854 domain-containing protein [Aeromicrobium fastidiosum]MBP2392489.1 hypothetical protein [Aeromicrobium fastidiosum]
MARKLSKRHSRELVEGSGISTDVIDARGYETVREKARFLEFEYESFQWTGPGLLIPIKDADGRVVGSQWKADEPRVHDVTDGDGKVTKTKSLKYDNPMGSRVRLDVPVGAAAGLGDASVPLFITEGAKKADAGVTAGLCCISVLGVWNWRSNGEPLRDWDHIKLNAREVFIAYDSDVMKKAEVQSALDALTAFLTEKGARVAWVVLPDRPSLAGENAKVGLDDWLVDNDMDPAGLGQFVRRPESNIRVNDVPLPVITRQAIAALHVNNEPKRLFSRDDLLVEARATGLQEVVKDRLTFLLGESANWHRATEKGRKPVPPPPYVTANVLAAGQEYWAFDLLDRIVTTPVFAADGTLRTEPGYHAPSRSYYLPPEGLEIPRVSTAPKKREVREAKALIHELFQDFAFVDDADRVHAWALLLQPFARELIRGVTPLYSVQAPKQGTGKTLLVQSALAPSAGVVDSYAEPHGDEEMEKRLTSVIREAAPVVFFDNIDRKIHYPSLASALTKATWSGRVLGKSATVTMPIQCTFVLTANNPQFSEDIKRRAVPIRLDARVEDPSRRENFTLSLPAWALERRGELVWSACTLIASWVAAGKPKPDADTAVIGSFGAWRRVMGGIVEHVGLPGFLGNLDSKTADKPLDAEAFELICAHAVNKYGDGQPWFAGDLAEHMFLADVELDFGRRYRDSSELASVLGSFLRTRRGQIVSGYRLEKGEVRRSRGFMWRFSRADVNR